MAAPPPPPSSCQNGGHTSLTDALLASSTAAARLPSPAATSLGHNTGRDRYTLPNGVTTAEERRRFVVDVLSAAIAIAEEVTRDVQSDSGADQDDNAATGSRDSSQDPPARPRQ
jgi:hypothetical protein